jgi:hypothetical protein
MGNCHQSNCDPCTPDSTAINQLVRNAANYARQSQTYSVNSENSATNAENIINQGLVDIEQILNDFEELYLGAKNADPTTNNQGGPLQVGALYWNSVSNELKVWNGSVWQTTIFNQFSLFLTNGTTEQRNLFNRLTDGVTPKDFGADPSLPNNTAALQAWLNHGGRLEGTAGTYAVTSTLVIPNDNTHINGNGMEITYNTSSRTSVIEITGRSNITIRDLKINGRKDLKTATGTHAAYGLYFENTSNIIVDGCYIQNTLEHGIRVGIEASSPNNSNNVKIINNTLFECGNTTTGRGAGIWLYGLVSNFFIENNSCLDCPILGIGVDDSHSAPDKDVLYGVISNNITTSSAGVAESNGFLTAGIGISGTRKFTITGNVSYGYGRGFSISSVQARTQAGYSQITGNYFEGIRRGVNLVNVQYVNFCSNTVVTTSYFDVDSMCINAYSNSGFIANSYLKEVIIANNQCFAYGKGIAINDNTTAQKWADNILITGNSISYTGPTPVPASVDGIIIDETTDNSRPGKVEVVNNNVNGFNNGIYWVTNTPTRCIGNIVSNCENWGIRTNNGTFALIARNTCKANAVADFHVDATGNVATTILKDNEAFSATPLSGGASTTKQNNLNF